MSDQTPAQLSDVMASPFVECSFLRFASRETGASFMQVEVVATKRGGRKPLLKRLRITQKPGESVQDFVWRAEVGKKVVERLATRKLKEIQDHD